MRRGLVVGVLVAVGAAGCGSGSSPEPSGPVETPLPAGSYASGAFQPTVTFTLPDGWVIGLDTDVMLTLRPAGSDLAVVNVFRDAAAASQASDCPSAAEPGVGTTSTELVAWIRERPGLVAGNPVMVTIGGLRGVGIDAGIRDGWAESCPFANGNPTVPLITGPPSSYHWVMYGTERLRVSVLDLPAGGTVTIMIDHVIGSEIDAFLGVASPIVRSMQFASG